MKRDIRHIPVLLAPVLEHLAPKPGDVVVDCTVGLGGHSAELLQRISPGGRLIALDLDPANLERARERLSSARADSQATSTFELHHSNFAGLPAILASSGITRESTLESTLE